MQNSNPGVARELGFRRFPGVLLRLPGKIAALNSASAIRSRSSSVHATEGINGVSPGTAHFSLAIKSAIVLASSIADVAASATDLWCPTPANGKV